MLDSSQPLMCGATTATRGERDFWDSLSSMPAAIANQKLFTKSPYVLTQSSAFSRIINDSNMLSISALGNHTIFSSRRFHLLSNGFKQHPKTSAPAYHHPSPFPESADHCRSGSGYFPRIFPSIQRHSLRLEFREVPGYPAYLLLCGQHCWQIFREECLLYGPHRCGVHMGEWIGSLAPTANGIV